MKTWEDKCKNYSNGWRSLNSFKTIMATIIRRKNMQVKKMTILFIMEIKTIVTTLPLVLKDLITLIVTSTVKWIFPSSKKNATRRISWLASYRWNKFLIEWCAWSFQSKINYFEIKKSCLLWWENLKRQRNQEGRSKITTWEKMKKEFKRKHLCG